MVGRARNSFYDKTGNAIDNVRDYAGDLYDKAGNVVYNARDGFYDHAGNAVDNVRDYAGALYDKTGNLLDNARSRFYDKAGNAVHSVRDYAGDLYDRTGKVVYNARDGFYDHAGNAVENAKDYAGDLYDKAGNVLENARDKAYDAKDSASDTISNKGRQAADYVGDKMHQAGDRVKQAAGYEQKTCGSFSSDSLYCSKDSLWSNIKRWIGTLIKVLITLGAILISAYLLIRMLSQTSTEETKKRAREISENIKEKAGRAKEAAFDIRDKAKHVIEQKLHQANGAQTHGDDHRRRDNETTHEYNLRITKNPVKHYGVDGDISEDTNNETFEEDTVIVDTNKHGRVLQK